jgi:hypothetical protein
MRRDRRVGAIVIGAGAATTLAAMLEPLAGVLFAAAAILAIFSSSAVTSRDLVGRPLVALCLIQARRSQRSRPSWPIWWGMGHVRGLEERAFDLGHDDIDGLVGLNLLNEVNFEVRSRERRIVVELIEPGDH